MTAAPLSLVEPDLQISPSGSRQSWSLPKNGCRVPLPNAITTGANCGAIWGGSPLEIILAAMFEAEFCPPEEKQARLQAREKLLPTESERTRIPVERLKMAILTSRYPESRRQRLANELPSIPPRLRNQ